MIFDLFKDPLAFLQSLLFSLPAILIGLVMHEVAHGYVAYRCGDPTAKRMGRLSLNPLHHLDPIGTLMMLIAGFGWAKPVPVNPNNFRHGRRDDLLVSLAGITMNMLIFLASWLALSALLTVAARAVPAGDWANGRLIFTENGQRYYYELTRLEAFQQAYAMDEALVGRYLGAWVGYLYRVIVGIAYTNVALALFNLIPIPPLDGYHVLNDLLLKGSFFADPRVARVCQFALMLVVVGTDWIDKLLTFLITGVFSGVGGACYALMHALGAL